MSEHRFRFRRGELELELAGERDFVEAQIAAWLPRLMGEAPAAPREQAPVEAQEDGFRRVPADFAPRVNLTLAEFVRLKAAESPLDLVTVAGYFVEKYRRQERFAPPDLARELAEVPAWAGCAIEAPFELAVAEGYIERLRDGRYTMTYKGQNYVRDGLAQ